MTIKRRLFFSNIRMLFISFAALAIIFRIMPILFFGPEKPDPQAIDRFLDSNRQVMLAMSILVFTLFIILVSIINNIVTHQMTKRIVKPLEPLNEGVRQIQNNNFAYRIQYKYNDEFRPVCDAFNEMAAKLESSEEDQKKNEANRKELFTGISHDLRTPLTSIKGYIEGLETGVASTPLMRKKYLSIIKNKAADIEHIIEQLFLFSELEMDEFPLNFCRTDIGAAVADMIDDSVLEYTSRGLDIAMNRTTGSFFVNADVIMLRNVIINIFENSVKYKKARRCRMEISVTAADDFVILRFADDGPGVMKEALPRLFDVFFRADFSRSQPDNGTDPAVNDAPSAITHRAGSGLGLAISAKIIERMGGSICAEQEQTAGKNGLAVIIKLPLLAEEKNHDQ